MVNSLTTRPTRSVSEKHKIKQSVKSFRWLSLLLGLALLVVAYGMFRRTLKIICFFEAVDSLIHKAYVSHVDGQVTGVKPAMSTVSSISNQASSSLHQDPLGSSSSLGPPQRGSLTPNPCEVRLLGNFDFSRNTRTNQRLFTFKGVFNGG